MQKVPARDGTVHAEITVFRFHFSKLPFFMASTIQLSVSPLMLVYRPYTLHAPLGGYQFASKWDF